MIKRVNFDIDTRTLIKQLLEELNASNEKKIELVIHKSKLIENISYIEEMCSILGNSGIAYELIIDGNISKNNLEDRPYIYSPEEVVKLNELIVSQPIVENKMLFVETDFDEYSWSQMDKRNAWTLKQVVYANKKLDEIVEHIKKMKLSPFETMLYIHKLASNSNKGLLDSKIYAASMINRNSSATFMGAIMKTGIVCAGISSLTRAIIEKLNIKGLSCKIVHVTTHENPKNEEIENYKKFIKEKKCDNRGLKQSYFDYKKYGEVGRHALCLIHLEDKKYKINGSYFNDAMWDNCADSFALCCYPINDALKFNDVHILQLPQDIDNKNHTKNLDKSAYKYVKLLKKGKYVPNIVQKYGEQSKPIEIEKYKKAIIEICLKENNKDFDAAVNETDEYLKNSFKMAKNMWIDDAANLFVQDSKKIDNYSV